MPNQETLYHVADRVATITLSRPDKLNAWTAVMEREVRAAMGEAGHDENVRVIVLTGAGRGFCAGADMSLLSTAGGRALIPKIAWGKRGGERDRVQPVRLLVFLEIAERIAAIRTCDSRVSFRVS